VFHHPGIGNENVNSAQAGCRLFDHFINLAGSPYVALQGQTIFPHSLNLGGDSRNLGFRPCGDGDIRTLGRERQSDCAADAASPARDERPLSFKPHERLP
jgi:hypothetical protein